jgi:hypothetical protein
MRHYVIEKGSPFYRRTFNSASDLLRRSQSEDWEKKLDGKRYSPDGGFNRIVNRHREREYFGYECPNCDIVLGSPKMRGEELNNQPGVSQNQITYECGICNKILHVKTDGMMRATD